MAKHSAPVLASMVNSAASAPPTMPVGSRLWRQIGVACGDGGDRGAFSAMSTEADAPPPFLVIAGAMSFTG